MAERSAFHLHISPDDCCKQMRTSVAAYVISGAGTGLHWEELDEDISVEHLLLGHGDRTQRSSVSS